MLLSLSLGREANSAEFYLTNGGCVNEGVLALPLDQLDVVLDLCLSNSDGYINFFNYSWVIEVTDDIGIVFVDAVALWAPDNGSLANADVVGKLTGTKGVPGSLSPGPVRVGTVTVDIGPGGGEIWVGSDGLDVTEEIDDVILTTVVPHTLVPEPDMQVLGAVMLSLLLLLGLIRRHASI